VAVRRALGIGIFCVYFGVGLAAAMSPLSTRWFVAAFVATSLACGVAADVLWDRPKRLRRLRRKRSERGQCVECGYSLAGNVSGVCPECGRRVEKPDEGAASAPTLDYARPAPMSTTWPWWANALAVAFGAAVLLFFLLIAFR
jgi:hypothetical protein